jgi:hypothetical protein
MQYGPGAENAFAGVSTAFCGRAALREFVTSQEHTVSHLHEL